MDSSGYGPILDSNYSVSVVPYTAISRSRLSSTSLKTILQNLQEDLANLNWANTSERKFLTCNYFTAYKGKLAVKFPNKWGSVSLGFVMLFSSEANENTVRHEYGHTVQLSALGYYKWIKYYAIPSFLSAEFDLYELVGIDYLNQPWETTASEFGGDTTEIPEPFKSFGRIYLILVTYFFD